MTLAEKIRAAAAKLNTAAEVKEQIAETVGAPEGSSMTAIKETTQQTVQTIAETVGAPEGSSLTEVKETTRETVQSITQSLEVPDDTPLVSLAPQVAQTVQSLDEHKAAVSQLKTALSLGAGSSLSTVVNRVQTVVNSSSTFYKCASVDHDAKTWTGFKAVLSDSAYSFEEAATAGLKFGNALIPNVDGIYDGTTRIYVNRLWMGAAGLTEGLVIHAPLQYRAETAETGQAMTYPVDYCTFGNVSGVACITFSGSSKHSVKIDSSGIVINTNPMTLACWVHYTANQFEDYFGWPDWNDYNLIIGRNSGNYLFVDGGYNWGVHNADARITDNKWHHLCLTWDGEAREHILYLDGQQVMSQIETKGPSAGAGTATYMYIHSAQETSYADFRLYNRALDVNEVALLAANLPA